MNKKSAGYYVEWIDGRGSVQKGIIRHEDQKPSLYEYDKVFIRLCNDDLSPKKDESGKQIISLKEASRVKIIGFID